MQHAACLLSTFVTVRSLLFDCLCVRRPLQAALIQDYICEACEKKTGRITTFVDNVSRRGATANTSAELVDISADGPVVLTMCFVLLFFPFACFVVCF